MDGNTLTLLIGLGLIMLGAILKVLQVCISDNVLEKQKLEYKPSKVSEEMLLGTGNGIGFSLFDGFSCQRYYNGHPVMYCSIYYHFFVILYMPIIPLGCYDAYLVKRQHKTAIYQIRNKQVMNKWEILYLYCLYWGFVLIVIGLIMFVCCILAMS